MNKIHASIYIGFGLLAMSAVITEIVTLIGRGTFNIVNFFSFFTIESNLFAAVILIIGGYYILKHKIPSTRFNILRGASTLYMTITGIVFSLLLAGLEGVQLTAVPWDNTVLHYIMPLAVVALWCIDPPKQRMGYRVAFLWLLFPAAYGIYTWVRGAFVNWYPYPFMNPEISGIQGLVIVSLGLAIGGVAAGLLLAWRANYAVKSA